MERTERTQFRKPHSWWWDNHISPENSKWLSENLKEMENQVIDMLGLLEEGESSADQERPMLITHVKNFDRMYRALAERYDNVTGALRKNIPSSLQLNGSLGVAESDSETGSLSPSMEPDIQDKMAQQKQKKRPDCFDVSISSGVSSDVSKKGSDGSSSSSESDSDLDEAKEGDDSGIFALSQRIIKLEDELQEAREKLGSLEEKNIHCQCNFGASLEISEHEEKMQVSDAETNNLEKNLEEINSEKKVLEAVLLANKNEIDGLNGVMASAAKQFETELAQRDLEIDKCKQEFEVLSEKFLCDKSSLEAEIGMLHGVIKKFEGDLGKMSQEKLHLQSQIEELERTACSLDCSASEMSKLQEVINTTQAELEKASLENEENIKNLETQLEIALQEKSILQDRIKQLEQLMCESLEKHSQEKSSLSAELSKLSEANTSLQAKLASMETEIKQVYADKAEESLSSEKKITGLNQDLKNLVSKLELISSEKATVDSKAATLLTDVTARDEKMKQMNGHLNQLQLEHAKIMAEADAACKFLSQLQARVSELEKEVDKQKLVIIESAEEKREAIRQLCFSIEHYRSEYKHLREMMQGHKRPFVMAT